MRNKILDLIPKGEGNAIHMSELAMLLGLEERDVRRLVLQNRDDGHIICSSVQGYFYPENTSELLSFYTCISKRARTSYRLIRNVKIELEKRGIDTRRVF